MSQKFVKFNSGLTLTTDHYSIPVLDQVKNPYSQYLNVSLTNTFFIAGGGQSDHKARMGCAPTL